MTLGSRCARQREVGSVLIITLVVLLTLTMLALAASHLTKVQTRSSAAAQRREVAFQAAEAALRSAERLLQAQHENNCDVDDRCRIYPAGRFSSSQLMHEPLAWWARYGWPYTEANSWPARDERLGTARFVIEDLKTARFSVDGPEPADLVRFYRVTAANTDSDHPAVVLQAILAIGGCGPNKAPTEESLAVRSQCSTTPIRTSWRQLR
jgi:type IV pilus assembly protein PilX